MYLLVQGKRYSIDDVLASYSPLLSTMMETEVGVDFTMYDEKKYLILDLTEELANQFDEYVKFLLYEDFNMNDDSAQLFSFLGHPNMMQYPLDYWKVKLRDNWIRDNFEKLELWQDPFFGLIQLVSTGHDEIDIPAFGTEGVNFVVAGGAALYLASSRTRRSRLKDIDIFIISRARDVSKVNEMIKEITFTDYHNKYESSLSGNALNTYVNWHTQDRYMHTTHASFAQYILRIYRSPSEVVHGFDLDSCGVLYVSGGKDGKGKMLPGKLYATERAKYALDHRVNYVDPARASPSYAYRLAKYQRKGFNITLPGITDRNLNRKQLKNMWNKMTSFIVEHSREIVEGTPDHDDDDNDDHYYSDDTYSLISWVITYYRKPLSTSVLSDLHFLTTVFVPDSDYIEGSIFHLIDACLQHRRASTRETLLREWRSYLPRDDISILLLSRYVNFFTSRWIKSDYSSRHGQKFEAKYEKADSKYIVYPFANLDTSILPWKVQDPGTQITSTFAPTPIDDLETWYRSSPLYKA